MILFACDEGKYLLNETCWAIRSLDQVMPEEKVLLILIDGTDQYLSKIKSWHRNIEVVNYKPNFAISIKDPGFFFSFKALVLADAMMIAKEPVLFLDGDIIVRKPLNEIFSILEKYHITARYRPFLDTVGPMGSPHSAKINSGVLGLSYNELTLDFLVALRKRIEDFLVAGGAAAVVNEKGQPTTGIDQEAFWLEYLSWAKQLRFWPLADSFNDSYFRQESEIWHAKGVRRQHAIYQYAVRALDSRELAEIEFADALIKQQKIEKSKSLYVTNLVKKLFSADEVRRVLATLKSDSKILVINSNFLIANEFDSEMQIDCIDFDPVSYHANKAKLGISSNVRHRFEFLDSYVEADKYDAAIIDHSLVPVSGSKIVLRQTKNVTQCLHWSWPKIEESELQKLISELYGSE